MCQLTTAQKNPREDTVLPTLEHGNACKKFASVFVGNSTTSYTNKTNTRLAGDVPTGTSPVSYILRR